MQKFCEVFFDCEPLFEREGSRLASEISDFMHERAMPFYASLNGSRKNRSGYLRKLNLMFGDFRGIVIRLSTDDRSEEIGRVVSHGQRGPFTGTFLYSNVQISTSQLLGLADGKASDIGSAVVKIYDDGLAKVRGRFGVPNDFLCEFIRKFKEDNFVSRLEHSRIAFPEFKLTARLLSDCSPVQEKHFLSVRRHRSTTDHQIHIGTIDKPHATPMHHNPTFDGTAFALGPWLRQPYWPVSFCRDTVAIQELVPYWHSE